MTSAPASPPAAARASAARRRMPERVRPTVDLERALLGGLPAGALLAGVDEVGRGALGGPVSVGVAVVDADACGAPFPDQLADSKLLRPAVRDALCDPVRAWVRGVAVGHAQAAEIDRFGILGGLRLAAARAFAELAGAGLRARVVLLDGTHDWLTPPPPSFDDLLGAPLAGDIGAAGGDGPPRAPGGSPGDVADFLPSAGVRTVIKGDARCASIAAASVLAKVTRDALMAALPEDGYGWATHKGYGSATHLAALRTLGPGPLHRRSWRLPGIEGDQPPAGGVPAGAADGA